MKNLTLILLLLSSQTIFAQQPTTILDSVNFYGSLRAHVAFYNNNVEVQNNASRIGFYLDRKIVNGISAFGGLELGTNLVNNNKSFNPDAATHPNESFFTETEPAVSTRLGFVGIKHKIRFAFTW